MHTYTNPFHRVHYTASSPVIRTAVQPESYRGHQIFKINAKHYDVVKDGVLVAQRAGPNGARSAVDERLLIKGES